ncbi:hypothetical protein D3C72_2204190 [compost metagenome]
MGKPGVTAAKLRQNRISGTGADRARFLRLYPHLAMARPTRDCAEHGELFHLGSAEQPFWAGNFANVNRLTGRYGGRLVYSARRGGGGFNHQMV